MYIFSMCVSNYNVPCIALMCCITFCTTSIELAVPPKSEMRNAILIQKCQNIRPRLRKTIQFSLIFYMLLSAIRSYSTSNAHPLKSANIHRTKLKSANIHRTKLDLNSYQAAEKLHIVTLLHVIFLL